MPKGQSSIAAVDAPKAAPFYHGTKADLQPGDLLGPGYASNYGRRRTPEQLGVMRDHLAELARLGVEAIED